MKPIVIVDYGMANLRSVQKAFEKVGSAAEITGDPSRVGEADKLVLPGVGAFRDAIARLRETGLVEPIREHLRAGKPFFGICLGLELLFTTSHEDGTWRGLDYFPGEVVRFADVPGLKVPHMGWNQLAFEPGAPGMAILDGVPTGAYFYFVHSYYPEPRDDAGLAVASCEYGVRFPALVTRGPLYGIQFHPEKSQRWGLRLLENFARLAGVTTRGPRA